MNAVKDLAEVWVVAPETEQSATSHALSLHRPLRIHEHQPRWFGIDGTPADCVYVAVAHLMKDQRPALVLSGINHGPNLATDVIYSGTVAAAIEGAVLGFPSIAFSLVTRRRYVFDHAAKFARSLVQAALATELPKSLVLNVNIPAHTDSLAWQVTRLGRHTYGNDVVERQDPRGRSYFWIGGTGYEHEKAPGTDVSCVHDEQVSSVTPLMLDLTEVKQLDWLRTWTLDGFRRAEPESPRSPREAERS